ncbi:hypothetical protein V8G54_033426 [Vigna mungo]|uniref:Neutral ceramidase n=1 Tax=Vigna mungo TaxID=3915 RepID=A0AAQ3RGC0_VIGMU
MAGRRLRDVVKTVLTSEEDFEFDDIYIVIAGLSNTYSQYITTYEEHQVQRYEGASTLYGPHTLSAYIQEFKKLAMALINDEQVEPGPQPPDFFERKIGLLPPVVVDGIPLGVNFGDVCADLPQNSSFKSGDMVKASFWSACPRNDLMTEGTFLHWWSCRKGYLIRYCPLWAKPSRICFWYHSKGPLINGGVSPRNAEAWKEETIPLRGGLNGEGICKKCGRKPENSCEFLGRVWNQEKGWEDSLRRGRGSSEEELDEDQGGAQPNWVKRVELPTFEGFDPMGWIARAEKVFETQGVIKEENKDKAKNCSWEGLKEAMVVRFGGRKKCSASAFHCTRSQEASDWSIIESLILVNKIVVVEVDCFIALFSYHCPELRGLGRATQPHAVLPQVACGATTVGGKLLPNFDYELFEVVERVVRAREERGMVDPESDTEAGNNVCDVTMEIGHCIQKPKLEQRHEDNHEEEHEEKPFFSWVKREEVEHKVVSVEENNNKSNIEGVVEQAISGVEMVKAVDVATEDQEEQRGLVVLDTTAEGRELLEALKDIKDHFLRVYDSRKEVTRMLEVNRFREEWKTLEEDWPPPKPPDLNGRAIASGLHSYHNTMMKKSQEIKFHGFNLEDKVVLQRDVMIGYNGFRIEGRKKENPRKGVGEKKNEKREWEVIDPNWVLKREGKNESEYLRAISEMLHLGDLRLLFCIWHVRTLWRCSGEQLSDAVEIGKEQLSEKVTVSDEGDSEVVKTCPAAMGFAFAAETTDGPGAFDFTQGDDKGNPFWKLLRDLLKTTTKEQID